MTTAVSSFGSGYLMLGLLAALDSGGGSAYAELYDGTRPSPGGTPTGALVSTVSLASPAGTVDGAGALQFDPGPSASVIAASMPTWARVFNSGAVRVLDCDVRSSSATDLGQELVIFAPSLTIGALLSILSGSYSATP